MLFAVKLLIIKPPTVFPNTPPNVVVAFKVTDLSNESIIVRVSKERDSP